ncbi:hypothetical protein CHS0354_027133 [Potamilus streckersoni]|uniref:Uncharacterized protein n=1 Tax=Potamilus streckersoni TaxID=2493646 RepID=A0AAE0SY88_9BIVA|nr:hypothetical protein CHS0354_027133 [Potamilus streckersoni]
MDGKKGEVPFCSKKHGRHPTLLPGIFTVFCQHGVCYGYQIMKLMESPNIPFPFLRTRFEVDPEAVICDKAIMPAICMLTVSIEILFSLQLMLCTGLTSLTAPWDMNQNFIPSSKVSTPRLWNKIIQS